MQFLNFYPSQKRPILTHHPSQYLMITDAKVDNHFKTKPYPLKHHRTRPHSLSFTRDFPPPLSLLHYYSVLQALEFLQLLSRILLSD